MFILFDAKCRKCHRSLKAEADCEADPPTECGRYRCVCPRCYTTIALRGEQGVAIEEPNNNHNVQEMAN